MATNDFPMPFRPATPSELQRDPDPDGFLDLLPTWPADGPKPAPPSTPGAVAVSVPAGPLPFGPGSGRRLGEPRR